MYALHIHKDVVADLEQIKAANDLVSHGTILAFLQQAKRDQGVLESLSMDYFGETVTENITVRRWIEQQKQGRNLWRVKICSLERLGLQYRILYAFHPQQRVYYVLAVLHRDFDYDESEPRVKQLLSVYDRLGIPAYV